MLEALMMAVLGIAYISACSEEKKEKERAHEKEKTLQEELDEIEQQTNLEIMYFYYSWYNNIPYNKVRKMHEAGAIKIEELQKCYEEYR